MWDYRYDRADEIWDNCGDFYDDCFDDRWWGALRLGLWLRLCRPLPGESLVVVAARHLGGGHGLRLCHRSAPAAGVYRLRHHRRPREGKTVYVDNKPMPAEKYNEPIVELATTVEQPPPPMPPAEEGKPAEWMPLGVFALAQEEKGDPVMFFQISVSRDGKISGGYESTLTGDQKPIAGTGGQGNPERRVAHR